MSLKKLCCLKKLLKGTAREQSALLGSNTDGTAARDEVKWDREGLVNPPFLNLEHFRALIEKNPSPSTSIKQPITMAKKKEKKLNYFAGRITFRGEAPIMAASYKSLNEIQEAYPQWAWESSTEDKFNACKTTILNVRGE